MVEAPASPHIVPVPLSDPAAVDPGEALVAAVSSCHMLWFLDAARAAGLMLSSYTDTAKGRMSRTENNIFWLSEVQLRRPIEWTGPAPTPKLSRPSTQRRTGTATSPIP